MIIELKQVFEIVGDSLPIDYNIDLSSYELFDDHPFITPVSVKGDVYNRSGIVCLNYQASFSLRLHCDRCLKVFNRDFNLKFEQTLVTELNTDNDEYIVVEDFKLDLDELLMSDILLGLPSKILCDRGCKGLCSQCGIDKNQESCLCKKTEVDPRLAVLSQLLNDEEDDEEDMPTFNY